MPVTVKSLVVRPPKNWTVVVVNEPRAVTLCKVSLSTVPLGQPTPLCKHTATPMTVAVENVPMFARICAPVAVENESNPVLAKFVEVPFVSVVLWSDVRPETVAVPKVTEPADKMLVLSKVPVAPANERLVAKKFVVVASVPVAEVQVRLVALTEAAESVEAMRFVISPLVAKRFVVVALVPVAFVKVTPAREELPVTDNVPVALMSLVRRPPKSVSVVVVKAPRLVADWRVSTSTDEVEGQPTPFCRQIPCPATVAEAKVAKLAWSVEAVAFKKEPVPRTARPVEVTFDPVAFVKVRPERDELPVTDNVPATLSVPVTELDAATKPPKNSTVVVVNDPRAVTDWRVSFAETDPVPVAKTAHPVLVPTPVSLIYIRPFVESITRSPIVPVTLPSGKFCEMKNWISSAKFSSVNTGMVEASPDETCNLEIGEDVPMPIKPLTPSARNAEMPLGKRVNDPSAVASIEPKVAPPSEEMLSALAPLLPTIAIKPSSSVELTVNRAAPVARVMKKSEVLVPPAN